MHSQVTHPLILAIFEVKNYRPFVNYSATQLRQLRPVQNSQVIKMCVLRGDCVFCVCRFGCYVTHSLGPGAPESLGTLYRDFHTGIVLFT